MFTRRGLAGSVLIGGGRSVCTGRTSIRNGCSLGSLGSRGSSSGNKLLGVPRMAVEKDWICSVFTRPSFDSSAYHTTSKCSHDELLRAFFDAQEDTVQKLVRDLNLLLARFQEQDLFSSMLQAWLVGETHAEMHVGMQ